MASNFESEFVDWMFARQGKFDWIVGELGIPVEELKKAMPRLEQLAKDNKGIVNVQLLRSKKDPAKVYAKYNTYKPKQVDEVKAHEQMPDRDTDDLPF
jgi:hypothetical protein